MVAHIHRNIFWRTLEGITFIATALIQYAVLTRYVSVSTVGIFSLVFAWTYLIASLSFNMGIKMILTRDLSQGEHIESALSNAMVLQAIISFSMLALFVPIAYSLSYFNEIRQGLLIIVSVDLILFPILLLQSIIQAREEMHKMALINCTSYIVSVILEVLVLVTHQQFYLIYWAIAAQLVLQAALTLIVLRGEKFFHASMIHLREMWKLLLQVFPVVMLGIVTMLYIRTDVFMIDYYLDKKAVGYYTAAYTYLDYLMLISNFMMSAIFPNFSKYIKEDQNRYRKLYRSILVLFMKYLYPLAIFLIIFPKMVIGFFYAEEYTIASQALQILMLASMFAWLNGPSGTILIGYKKQHLYLYATACSLAVNVVANYFLIPLYGINGAALATLFTEMTLLTYCIYEIKKLSGYIPFLSPLS